MVGIADLEIPLIACWKSQGSERKNDKGIMEWNGMEKVTVVSEVMMDRLWRRHHSGFDISAVELGI
jgi:hypothetical protein